MATITEKKLRVAIAETRGNLTGAARKLGVSRQAVHDAVDKYSVQSAVLDARTLRVEKAEDVLDQAVDRKQPWAVSLTLKCLGKHLGYVERIQDVAAVSNMEALRRIVGRLGLSEIDDVQLMTAVAEVKAELDAERG